METLRAELRERLVPTLETFPKACRNFLDRAPKTDRAATAIRRARLALRGKGTVREYILDDYLVLYLERPGTVDLLAIKHHHQLSYAFDVVWR